MAAKDVEAGRAHVLIRLRDQVSGGLKKAERNLASFGRSFATAGAALATAGVAGLAFPLKLAADMEVLQVNFEVMLGSADAAKKMLAELSDFAKKTPFGMADLSRNAKLLLDYKLDAQKVLPTLNALGNAAAGDAEKLNRLTLAFGQVTAKTKLMGGETMQMTEAGLNPLQIIAEATGRKIPELTDAMSKGSLSADLLASSLQYVYGPTGRLGSQMEKASGTTLGLVSTLMNAVSFGFKPIGDAALTVLKPLVKFGIAATDAFAAFMDANKGLAKAVAYTLIGMVAVGGVLTAIGLAAMALSGIVNALGFAVGLAASAFSLLFSPIGLALLGLISLGIAAFQFRDQLYAALVSVATYFQPLTDALGRIWTIFRETFDGVVTALMSGKLSEAAGVAWLGLVAAAWQGVADLAGAMSAGIDMLGAIIPAVTTVRGYISDAFASIGQAILAGRWDLAAAIAMTKVQIAVETGMNVLRGFWTGFTTVLGDIWDTLVFGIRSSWRDAVTNIAKGFITIAEQFGFSMDGVRGELDRMAAEDQAADDKSKADRKAQRYGAGADAIAKGTAREKELRAHLAELEQKAQTALADAGSPDLQGLADNARKALDRAMEQVQQGGKPDEIVPKLRQQALSASDQVGKISSAGTFSASAAAQALGVDTGPARETANNTKKMLQLMQDHRPRPIFE